MAKILISVIKNAYEVDIPHWEQEPPNLRFFFLFPFSTASMLPRNRLLIFGVLTVAWLLTATAADAQSFFSLRDPPSRGPKTLMKWSDAPEEEEAGPASDRIITDRPHLAEAAALVGLGRIQIENGYTYTLDRDSGTKFESHTAPETLIRAGVFREWFEFRFAYTYRVERTRDATTQTRLRGSDDIYVGAKVAIAEQHGILPEFTVFPQMRVPTGQPAEFSAGRVEPGVNFAYAWMITDKLELEVNTVLNRKHDDGLAHHYVEFFQPINFEYDLCEKIMLFNEFILIYPCGAIAAQTQYYEHAGVHYFILPNLQLDFHAAVGMNRAADDFFGGSGLSWRW